MDDRQVTGSEARGLAALVALPNDARTQVTALMRNARAQGPPPFPLKVDDPSGHSRRSISVFFKQKLKQDAVRPQGLESRDDASRVSAIEVGHSPLKIRHSIGPGNVSTAIQFRGRHRVTSPS
jgi:hypothetical protein